MQLLLKVISIMFLMVITIKSNAQSINSIEDCIKDSECIDHDECYTCDSIYTVHSSLFLENNSFRSILVENDSMYLVNIEESNHLLFSLFDLPDYLDEFQVEDSVNLKLFDDDILLGKVRLIQFHANDSTFSISQNELDAILPEDFEGRINFTIEYQLSREEEHNYDFEVINYDSLLHNIEVSEEDEILILDRGVEIFYPTSNGLDSILTVSDTTILHHFDSIVIDSIVSPLSVELVTSDSLENKISVIGGVATKLTLLNDELTIFSNDTSFQIPYFNANDTLEIVGKNIQWLDSLGNDFLTNYDTTLILFGLDSFDNQISIDSIKTFSDHQKNGFDLTFGERDSLRNKYFFNISNNNQVVINDQGLSLIDSLEDQLGSLELYQNDTLIFFGNSSDLSIENIEDSTKRKCLYLSTIQIDSSLVYHSFLEKISNLDDGVNHLLFIQDLNAVSTEYNYTENTLSIQIDSLEEKLPFSFSDTLFVVNHDYQGRKYYYGDIISDGITKGIGFINNDSLLQDYSYILSYSNVSIKNILTSYIDGESTKLSHFGKNQLEDSIIVNFDLDNHNFSIQENDNHNFQFFFNNEIELQLYGNNFEVYNNENLLLDTLKDHNRIILSEDSYLLDYTQKETRIDRVSESNINKKYILKGIGESNHLQLSQDSKLIINEDSIVYNIPLLGLQDGDSIEVIGRNVHVNINEEESFTEELFTNYLYQDSSRFIPYQNDYDLLNYTFDTKSSFIITPTKNDLKFYLYDHQLNNLKKTFNYQSARTDTLNRKVRKVYSLNISSDSTSHLFYDKVVPNISFDLEKIPQEQDYLYHQFDFSEPCLTSQLIVTDNKGKELYNRLQQNESLSIEFQLENLNNEKLKDSESLFFQFTLLDKSYNSNIIEIEVPFKQNAISNIELSTNNIKNGFLIRNSQLIIDYDVSNGVSLVDSLSKISFYNASKSYHFTLNDSSIISHNQADHQLHVFFAKEILNEFNNEVLGFSLLLISDNNDQRGISESYFVDINAPIFDSQQFEVKGVKSFKEDSLWLQKNTPLEIIVDINDTSLESSRCKLIYSINDIEETIFINSQKQIEAGFQLSYLLFDQLPLNAVLDLQQLILEDSAGNISSHLLEYPIIVIDQHPIKIQASEIVYQQESEIRNESLNLGQCEIVIPYSNINIDSTSLRFIEVESEVTYLSTITDSTLNFSFDIDETIFKTDLLFDLYIKSKSGYDTLLVNNIGPKIVYDITPPSVEFNINTILRDSDVLTYTFDLVETCSVANVSISCIDKNGNKENICTIEEVGEVSQLNVQLENLNSSLLSDISTVEFDFYLKDLTGLETNNTYTVEVIDNEIADVTYRLEESKNKILNINSELFLEVDLVDNAEIDTVLSSVIVSNTIYTKKYAISDVNEIAILLQEFLLEEYNHTTVQVSTLIVTENGFKSKSDESFFVDIQYPITNYTSFYINGIDSIDEELWIKDNISPKVYIEFQDLTISPYQCYLNDSLEVHSHSINDSSILLIYEYNYDNLPSSGVLELRNLTLEDSAGNTSTLNLDSTRLQYNKNEVEIVVNDINYYQDSLLSNSLLTYGSTQIIIPYSRSEIKNISIDFKGSDITPEVNYNEEEITIGFTIDTLNFKNGEELNYDVLLESKSSVFSRYNIQGPTIKYDIVLPEIHFNTSIINRNKQYFNFQYQLSEVCDSVSIEVLSNQGKQIYFENLNSKSRSEVAIDFENLNNNLLSDVDSLFFLFTLKDLHNNINSQTFTLEVVDNEIVDLEIILGNTVNNILKRGSELKFHYSTISNDIRINQDLSKIIIINSDFEEIYNIDDTTNIVWDIGNSIIQIKNLDSLLERSNHLPLTVLAQIVTENGDQKSINKTFEVDIVPPSLTSSMVYIEELDSIKTVIGYEFWAKSNTDQTLQLNVNETSLLPLSCQLYHTNILGDTIISKIENFLVKDGNTLLNYKIPYSLYEDYDSINVIKVNLIDSAGNESKIPLISNLYSVNKNAISIDKDAITFLQNNNEISDLDTLKLGSCLIQIPYSKGEIKDYQIKFLNQNIEFTSTTDDAFINLNLEIDSTVFNHIDSLNISLSVESKSGIITKADNIISPLIYFDIVLPNVHFDLEHVGVETEYFKSNFVLSETCQSVSLSLTNNQNTELFSYSEKGIIDSIFVEFENLNNALLSESDSIYFTFNLEDLVGNINTILFRVPVSNNKIKDIEIDLLNAKNNIISRESKITVAYTTTSGDFILNELLSKIILKTSESEWGYNLVDTTSMTFDKKNKRIDLQLKDEIFEEHNDLNLEVSVLLVSNDSYFKSLNKSFTIDITPPYFDLDKFHLKGIDYVIIDSTNIEYWVAHNQNQSINLTAGDLSINPTKTAIDYINASGDTSICSIETYKLENDSLQLFFTLPYENYSSVDSILLNTISFEDSAGNTNSFPLIIPRYNINKNKIDIPEITYIQNNNLISSVGALTYGSCRMKIAYHNAPIKDINVRFLEINNVELEYEIKKDNQYIYIDFKLDNSVFEDGDRLKYDLEVISKSGIITNIENILGPAINFSIPADFNAHIENVQINQWPYENEKFLPLEIQLNVKDTLDSFKSKHLQIKGIVDDKEIVLYESAINLIDSTTFKLSIDHRILTTPIGSDFRGELPLIMTLRNDFGERKKNLGIIVISGVPKVEITNEWSIFGKNAPVFAIETNLDSSKLLSEILYNSQLDSSIYLSNFWNIADNSINNKNIRNIDIAVEAVDLYGGVTRDTIGIDILDIPLFNKNHLQETYCHQDTQEVVLKLDSVYWKNDSLSQLNLKLFRYDIDGNEVEIPNDLYNKIDNYQLSFKPSTIYTQTQRETHLTIKLFYGDKYEVGSQSFKVIYEEEISTALLMKNIYVDVNNDIEIKLDNFDDRTYSLEILDNNSFTVIENEISSSQESFKIRQINSTSAQSLKLLLKAETEKGICGITQLYEVPLLLVGDEIINKNELVIPFDNSWLEQKENIYNDNVITFSDTSQVWNSDNHSFLLNSNEKREVVTLTSKSYNLSEFNYPILEIEYSSNLSTRNGVLVQLSQDENDEWITIGTTSEVVNWYNTIDLYNNDLKSNSNGYAWSGVLDRRIGKIFLQDYIDTTKANNKIRFRFVVSNGTVNESETFSLYNFRVYEKQGHILLESFFQADNSTHQEINKNVEQVLENLSRYDNLFNHYFYYERSEDCDNYLNGAEYIESRRTWYNLKSRDIDKKKFSLMLNGGVIEGETSQDFIPQLRTTFIKQLFEEAKLDLSINDNDSSFLNISYELKDSSLINKEIYWVVLVGTAIDEEQKCSDFYISDRLLNRSFIEHLFYDFAPNQSTLLIDLQNYINSRNETLEVSLLLQDVKSKEVYFSKFLQLNINDRVTEVKTLRNDHLLIRPNPVVDIVELNKAYHSSKDQLKILDNSGKEVNFHMISNEPNIRLNVEHLPSGVYFIHLYHNTKKQVIRFIKI